MSLSARIASPSFLDDEKLKRLFAALDGNGEELRVVGGAIRNHFMGVPVTEVDLTTTATPDVVIARAKAAGLKPVPTGLEHGTVTVVVDHAPFEVTTLREDVETDGRRAKVVFGRDFRADALRRDFTFNALSARADGTIFDYAAGMRDIEQRRVHFIGDPDTRIREDYLRILRFFRFHAAFGEHEADPLALAAIAKNRIGLNGLSRERVRAEVIKLLETRGAAETCELMSARGLLIAILGGVDMPLRLSRIMAIEQVSGAKADAMLRLAALAVLTPEDAQRLRDLLRLSNAEAARLEKAAVARITLHGAREPPDEKHLRAFLYRFGPQAARDALDLAHAQSGAASDDASWAEARRSLTEKVPPKLPFSGTDFLKLGIPAGKAVGEALKRAETAWIEADFPIAAERLAALLAAAAKPPAES